MSNQISPITIQVCTNCMLPWMDHYERARILAIQELEKDGVSAAPSEAAIAEHLNLYLCLELLRAAK